MTETHENSGTPENEAEWMPRRKFMTRLPAYVGWAAFWTWIAGSSIAAIRYMFPKVRYEPPSKFKIGKIDDYVVDSIDSRWLKEHRILVVRNPEGLYVLKSECTHLGCMVSWFNSETRFKCPCHGSFFDVEGDVIGGPAPGPLVRAAVSLDPTGNIVVDTSQIATGPEDRKKRRFLLRA